jgi:hypothetical protein
VNALDLFRQAIRLKDGPKRTAALAAWVQSLFPDRTPVLVGGAAVELYTGGAYTTGDLDFVGQVSPSADSALSEAGFRREGRHWVHETQEIFIEFPGSAVAVGEKTATIIVDGIHVLTLSPEDILVDRLSAWQFWKSATDGINAFLIWKAQRERLDDRRLASIARDRGVTVALGELRKLIEAGDSPSSETLEQWANRRS